MIRPLILGLVRAYKKLSIYHFEADREVKYRGVALNVAAALEDPPIAMIGPKWNVQGTMAGRASVLQPSAASSTTMNSSPESPQKRKGYFDPTWMGLGIGMGIAIGIALHNLPIGVCLGFALGLMLGGIRGKQNKEMRGCVVENDPLSKQ